MGGFLFPQFPPVEYSKGVENSRRLNLSKTTVRRGANRGHEDDRKFYVTKLKSSDRELLLLLVCRWRIECWHRDAKQHLGLEDYQVRKDRAVRNVVLAVLFAYTALVLSLMHSTLRRIAAAMGRSLRTIGEVCRFMRLAARKSWRWITRTLRERPELFREVLNREVLVKNAKV